VPGSMSSGETLPVADLRWLGLSSIGSILTPGGTGHRAIRK
jgi:hypothetical protein